MYQVPPRRHHVALNIAIRSDEGVAQPLSDGDPCAFQLAQARQEHNGCLLHRKRFALGAGSRSMASCAVEGRVRCSGRSTVNISAMCFGALPAVMVKGPWSKSSTCTCNAGAVSSLQKDILRNGVAWAMYAVA